MPEQWLGSFAAKFETEKWADVYRDNRGRDPMSIVLSEAGHTIEEHVVLDIPSMTH